MELTQSNKVNVAATGDEWEVTITEGGREAAIHFLLEGHAKSFAATQRVRLGLLSITSSNASRNNSA